MKLILFFVPLILCGCLRVNTSPLPDFEEVRNEIYCRSGEEIFPFQDCIDTLLEQELNIEQTVYIALINNRNLLATYEDLGIARAALVQAGLLPNPIFAMSYRFTTSSAITDLIDVSLLQRFLETLLIPLKKRAAFYELEATKLRVTSEVLDLIGHTKMAFLTLQAKEQMLELKQQEVLALECASEAAKRLFDAGNIKELVVTERSALYETSKIDLLALEVEVKQARETLNILMGLCGNQIHWKISKDGPEIYEWECGDIENRAIACSLELEIARQQIYATAACVGIETTRIVFPQMDMGVSSEREEGVWFVGPALSIGLPFFDCGQARRAAGRAEIFRQWNDYIAQAVAIRSMVRLDRMRLMNAARQWHHFHASIIPIKEKTTALTLLQHNAMQLGVIDLLDAKRAEIASKIASLEIAMEYWMARIELETLLKGHLM